MKELKRPKWDIGVTVSKGTESISLINGPGANVKARFQPDEVTQFEVNIKELGIRQSTQSEALVDQKSKTKAQDSAIGWINDQVMNIRKVVNNADATPEIKSAFGIGVRTSKTITGSNSAANMVKTAYEKFPEWSAKAGILPTDIEALEELQLQMGSADAVQESSKFARKAKTMDKNTLQVEVENMVTKVSTLGQLEFHKKDPALANLFASLIPSTGKSKNTEIKVEK